MQKITRVFAVALALLMTLALLPAASAAAENDEYKLAVEYKNLKVSLDAQAISWLEKEYDDWGVIVKRIEVPSLAASELLGDNPAFEVMLFVVKDKELTRISELKEGSVMVRIEYSPEAGENTAELKMVLADHSGSTDIIESSSYEDGWATAVSSDIKIFGVGREQEDIVFSDTGDHPAKDYVSLIANAGIMIGTSQDSFQPDTELTRAMFVTILGRIAGVDVTKYDTCSFSDVSDESYTMPYIEWAYDSGIVNGVGDGNFEPNRAITREEAAAVLCRHIDTGDLSLRGGFDAAAYDTVSPYAQEAVQQLQEAGVVLDTDADSFDPKAKVSRADAAVLICRFIDGSTSGGWQLYDDGRMQYIDEHGNLLTGWLEEGDKAYYFDIEGFMYANCWVVIDGKIYFFYLDGKMAKDTMIIGVKIGADGSVIFPE